MVKGVGMERISTTYRIGVGERTLSEYRELGCRLSEIDGVHEVAYVLAGEVGPLEPCLDIELDAAYDHVGTRDKIKELCGVVVGDGTSTETTH